MSKLEIPVGDEQDYSPQVGDNVTVNEPGSNDLWSHSFCGHSHDIITHPDGEVTYIIEDQDSDMWEMELDQFELDGEEF